MLAAGSIILATLGTSGAAFAADPSTTSTVLGSTAWYTQAYDNFPTGGYLTPRQDDVAGPQRAPYGTSSHRLTIGESSSQTELYRTDAYDGVPVADLTRLEYSSFARATNGGGDRQAPFLRLSVDTDDNGTTDDSLFFYPANNGTVENGTWQTWDVADGTIDVNGDSGGTTTLAQYAAAHDGATLVNDPFDSTHDAGALALIAGGALGGDGDPQTNGEYFLDRVIVGQSGQDTLYDLGGGSETSGATTKVTLDPAHDRGWKHQAYDDVDYLDSDQAFVDGPGTPPAGGGSLRMTLDSAENPGRVELFRTTNYDGTYVRDLRTLDFHTYQQATAPNATPQQPAYVRLSVDTDGDGGTDDSLYFYPGNNGSVQQSAWQSWHAATGLWNVNGDSGVPGAVTLEDYVVAHPDAKIVVNGDAGFPDQPRGGVSLIVGGGGASQSDGTYYVDDVTVRTVDAAAGRTVSGRELDLEPTLPTLAVGDATVSEGNRGATLRFPVTLSRKVVRAVTAHYATANGTAHAGSDFTGTSGTVTIPAGSRSGIIRVHVISDRVREAAETLSVNLSHPGNATLSDATGRGTITNDDTRVGLVASNATLHRVRATVSTLAAAPSAPVKVYRVVKAGVRLLFQGRLDSSGRISVVLPQQYGAGDRVNLVATVATVDGVYTSPRSATTVAR